MREGHIADLQRFRSLIQRGWARTICPCKLPAVAIFATKVARGGEIRKRSRSNRGSETKSI
jgi:hypothetical protein